MKIPILLFFYFVVESVAISLPDNVCKECRRIGRDGQELLPSASWVSEHTIVEDGPGLVCTRDVTVSRLCSDGVSRCHRTVCVCGTPCTPTPSSSPTLPSRMVWTFAGNGSTGHTNGVATGPGVGEIGGVTFVFPFGVAVGHDGTYIIVSDTFNAALRRVEMSGGDPESRGGGRTTTIATREETGFFGARGVAVDPSGRLWVTDTDNHTIFLVTPDTPPAVVRLAGNSTIGFADGFGESALFARPRGIALDPGSTSAVVADFENNCVRRVFENRTVVTIVGTGARGNADGPVATATLSGPMGVAFGPNGDLYVADGRNHRIRRVIAASGFSVVDTYAGTTRGHADGPTASAQFDWPSGVAVDGAGTVFVADSGNNRIRRILPGRGRVVETVAGDGGYGSVDGPGHVARFRGPETVAVTSSGRVFVADHQAHRVRVIDILR
eukprot:TRINITY_DN21191_c0_g1_i1.p1 TRINITY_DN21191_c0_g1~~TRINITY_DN21191_c0_g1_i1.p1  ORF type:complete len:440 (+),score=56.46 TRINITY_DN21191_c0_g1_i1:166-1485(+)